MCKKRENTNCPGPMRRKEVEARKLASFATRSHIGKRTVRLGAQSVMHASQKVTGPEPGRAKANKGRSAGMMK